MIASRGPSDVREFFGFDTPLTGVLTGAVVVAMTYGAAQNLDGVSPIWPAPVAIVIMAAATITLLMAPGDPIHSRAALMVALAAPVSSAILLPAVPVPLDNINQVWISGYATLLNGLMCLRGRAPLAWLSAFLTLVVYGTWSVSTDQGVMEGAAIPLFNIGALVGMTVVSIAIRPTFRSILALREANLQRVASASTVTAVQQERNTRLAELDEVARPLLMRIATGVPLTAAERQACELLEAHLRDQLRAAALVSPETAAAAREARARGVEVTMIDDGGLDGAFEEMRSWVHIVVTAALHDARDGYVRVRVLPMDRDHVVIVNRNGSSGTERICIGKKGLVERYSDAEHPGRNTPHLITPAKYDPSIGVTTKDVYLTTDPEV
ncbi:hypothetical protein [Williamsia sp. 1135]|uniref:hypothetical protein n=1 Tax=Williamsia sp. 1135 TaxID=1889262 RepID=UPI000A1127DD|nr:hypothetical protein [Williamsia sp. 1135]ORM32822.1 hypothetical protein BFL43_15035 [Williamsia sp. 1135]